MKTLVIGANGKIGTQLTKILKEDGKHTPIAMIRKEEQKDKFSKMDVDTVMGDLEDSVEELAEAMKGVDAVIFTAGSGGSTGQDKTLLIDLDGAVKSVEAAEKAEVDRFVIVSAIQAHNRENWSEKIKPYFVAKHYADRAVRDSNLNYTIVRPGGLTDEEGKGKVKAAENVSRDMIPRDDVAATLAAIIDRESTYKKEFDLVQGDQSIEEAISAI